MPEVLPLQPGDPRRLGAYEVTGRLGVGEQGAVFLGRDPAGAQVAVQVLHVRLSGDPADRSRFAGAFTSARRVSGFCTAAILNADVEGELPFVVSEWVDGPSLHQLVAGEGPRGEAVLERVAVGLAIAIAAVHRAGAAHLDLRPGNVLLGRDGPRLTGFGIAGALEAVHAASGRHVTEDPSYRAPEQLDGRGAGPAADVFAWASTIVFAATGGPPFGTGSPAEVAHRVGYGEPDLTGVPGSLREVLAGAFVKDPAQRWTARDILQRLLDEQNPLASRMPPSMLQEGRALASGPPARPGPPPQPPMGGPPHPMAGQAPMPVPGMPGAPAGPAPDADPAAESASSSLRGKLSRTRRQRPPEPEPVTPPADLDLSAFEETTSFNAFEPRQSDQSARTATFDAVDFDPADSTEASPFVPGMGGGHDDAGHGAPEGHPRRRRPSNHVLGVALSLFIGVGVGVAIIALVLWPQFRTDDGPPPESSNAAENRPVTEIPASFEGTWKGTMVNTNSNSSFAVEVTFEAGGTTARAIYPRENCDGTLTLTRGTESALRMSLAVGQPCTPGVVEITRQPDGTLQYTWNRPGTDLGYGGLLTRE